MVDPQIVRYIEDNLKKGYNVNQIRQYLINNGWNSFQVDEAINYIYYGQNNQNLNQLTQNNESQKQNSFLNSITIINSKKITLLGIGIILIFAFIFASYMLFFNQNEVKDISKIREIPFSYSIEVENKKVESGNSLIFINKFTGSAVSEVIYPKYTILSESGSLIDKWESTSPIILGSNEKIKHELSSSLASGNYRLISEATYKGRKLNATDEFRVYKESIDPSCEDGIKNQGEEGIDCGGPCKPCPSCFDGLKNQGETGIDCGGPCKPCKDLCEYDCNDYNLCTEDKCVDGRCINEMIFPCCGNFICESEETKENCPIDCDIDEEKPVHLMSRSEIMTSAKQKALLNEKDAGYFCDSVTNSETRDECLRIVAYTANNKNFCKYINFSVKRDSCYMEFAMKYDYSVCILIQNQYLQRSCEALKVRPSPEAKEND